MKELLATILQHFISENKDFEVAEDLITKIKRIQKICNKHYSNQLFCGNAALNRAILLDTRIAQLLTPDTLLAIMAIHADNYKNLQKDLKISDKSIMVKRNNRTLSLAAVLFYGFSEGIEVIKCISNNEKDFFNEKIFFNNYSLQAENFANNTQKIINSIKNAALALGLPVEFEDEPSRQNKLPPVEKLYHQIKATIELINHHNFTRFFLRPVLRSRLYSKKPIRAF